MQQNIKFVISMLLVLLLQRFRHLNRTPRITLTIVISLDQRNSSVVMKNNRTVSLK